MYGMRSEPNDTAIAAARDRCVIWRCKNPPVATRRWDTPTGHYAIVSLCDIHCREHDALDEDDGEEKA